MNSKYAWREPEYVIWEIEKCFQDSPIKRSSQILWMFTEDQRMKNNIDEVIRLAFETWFLYWAWINELDQWSH